MEKYRIVRMFQSDKVKSRAVRGLNGLTLDEAQAHCRSADSSWKTCSSKKDAITRKYGPWFEGYEAE